MILAQEQVDKEYFCFSSGSNGADEDEFVSLFTLQSHFYVKYKRWKYNQ